MILRIQKFLLKTYVVDSIAFLGFLGYSLLSIFFAHVQRPILDEGLYTYKGWLFVSGRYSPYQDYGPWMNHMPFSFIIPGTIQVLFGPGFRTGRYFAIFCSIVMIVGLYLTSRRLSGRWTATLVVWAFVLNFATIQTYSVAISQGLVACVLTWIMYFSLGDDRSLWQISLAVFLSAMLVVIRINMFPIFVFLPLYLWWEHGWTKARWAIAVAILSFIGFQALYWPEILQNWLKWFPLDLGTTSGSVIFSDQDLGKSLQISYAHIDSLFFTVRSHFVAIAGAIATWALWPRRKQWGKQTYYHIAVFLSVTFAVMFLAHSWASLGKNYCVLCLPVYTAFFQILGILLMVVSWKFWKRRLSFINQLLIILVIIILFIGIAYSLNETLDFQPNETIHEILLLSQKPQQDTTMGIKGNILNAFSNIFVIKNRKDIISLSRRLSLSYYGFIAGLLFLFLVGILWYIRKKFLKRTISFGSFAIYSFMFVGFLLIPSKILSNNNAFQCKDDQISNIENIGKELAQKIPDGSQIYWLGYSPSLLLYLPNVYIFPPQLNGYNTFSISSNSNELYRNGLWNGVLADYWAMDATHMIVTQLAYESPDRVVKEYLKSGIYSEMHLDTSSFYTCDTTNQLEIRLFKKNE